MKRLLYCLLLAASPCALGAGEVVGFPGPGIKLVGRLYPAAGDGRFRAVVLLHGCSGMWTRAGHPNRSYEAWADHFQKRGITALLVDSFGPRGEREICTQRERGVRPGRERTSDAYAALKWLAGRPDVDPARIHLLGWSNGGTTVLEALRPEARGREPEGPRFRSGVAFYPGCRVLSRTPYQTEEPLLIQAGAADDWTPARDCLTLIAAAKGRGGDIEIDVYDEAHHAFDRIDLRTRHRPEVRNPSSPTGWGATVGGDSRAREKSMARATAFLERD